MVGRILKVCLALQLILFVYGGSDETTNGLFSSDLFYAIANDKESQNVVVSPVSIQTCLAMAFFGAEGKTAEEMATGLHLGTSNKQEVAKQFEKLLSFAEQSSSINIANKIFVKNGIEIHPQYNENIKKSFNSEAEIVDFKQNKEAAKFINDWVESKTNNKIKNLVLPEALTPDTSMLLVNALHFKANWAETFGKSAAKDDFWLNKDNKVSVNIMRQEEFFNYADLSDLDATGIELPYKNSNFSMMILLPNKRDGLKALEEKLKTNNFLDLPKRFKNEYVYISMPKFEIEFSLNLNDVLKELGMKTMYTSEADFSSLLKSQSVQVSDVIHKAFVNVDEEGTEAAAATYLQIVPTSGIEGPPPKKFIVDHPFVFVIKDHSSVYFVGHIAKF